ncbi:uncharacterized protein LOC106137868 [Amyelois transitella]|uniref:uncharacterized protein LOC106137868 n=1 Tax=Amyelois transitella TaxID=680683 RepID=UPI00067D6BF8|nr:uncharacterized protein LOC106137868 [Amyelois transitella]
MSKVPHHSRKNTSIVKGKRRLRYSKQKLTPESSHSSLGATTTYSTSAIANVKTCSNSIRTTEGTLSMISTPWSTDYNSFASFKSTPIQYTRESSETILPKSSSSVAAALTPDNASIKTTITLFNVPSVDTDPPRSKMHLPKPTSKQIGSKDTLSSWTIESFTSDGIISNSQIVKPKYPWSPSTVFSGTDLYPTTVDTLVSRKGSRESWAGSGSIKLGNKMAPMNANDNKSEDDFILDGIMIKTKGVPIVWNYH